MLDKRAVDDIYSLIARLTGDGFRCRVECPRCDALQALAEMWPDETTRELLAQRASVDGFAASRFGGQHSEFGRIVLTKDLDGIAPYLDPQRPVPHEHIEKAAMRCNIPPEQVDAQVASLSKWLGWNITQAAPPETEA